MSELKSAQGARQAFDETIASRKVESRIKSQTYHAGCSEESVPKGWLLRRQNALRHRPHQHLERVFTQSRNVSVVLVAGQTTRDLDRNIEKYNQRHLLDRL